MQHGEEEGYNLEKVESLLSLKGWHRFDEVTSGTLVLQVEKLNFVRALYSVD